MGLFDFLDKFRSDDDYEDEWEAQEKAQDDWNDIVYDRKSMDMDDNAQRREYVDNCLQQMSEAQRELNNLEIEYSDVTSHLRDMEEIDALPKAQRQELNNLAKKIKETQDRREDFKRRKSRMSDLEFERIDRLQDEMKSGSDKMKEAESYQKKVKNDLRRLDNEHDAYLFQREELEKTIHTCRSLIVSFGISVSVLIIFLFIIGRFLEFNVTYGYMAAALIAAVAITAIYVKYTDCISELKSVNIGISRLIMLQNTVKIRYVNNTNLLEYLRIKFGVNSSKELGVLYDRFIAEKKERERFAKSIENYDSTQKDLIFMLRHFRIQDPEIWIHQVDALLDHNEEVEIRHSLNKRRQALRKRMEYNKDVVAGNAKKEIENLAHQYPDYTQEILDMVSRYESLHD